ncbi:metal-dependent hydrolase [Campylobacter novaezeelandiae]|uniref:aminofutalosine deaminase family hydrolase n=1 Tax=Campylobacter novaezeelandiae TaxID=2267891 RepID=UPI0010379B2C|nr:metal-dependent hydrolase [Campylobacter novaezeelandiae]TBR79222.1 metal-dependent hydrolase [Campylobacter novaezeelandiae]TBR80962.1 metal-dependent hydrolase [Campylobacter novaezeelandiae]
MKIIYSDKIFLCNEKFNILEKKALAFKEEIIAIDSLETLQKKYPKAELIKSHKHTLLLPSFINPHTHLEFSANSYTLHFGEFLIWLKSIINSRDELSKEAKNDLILEKLNWMRKTGTATIGEISSFGSDLKPCVKASKDGMRIIFFNEILGSNENQISVKKEEFLKRFQDSLKHKSDLFIPAVSVHSAYSTHPKLAKFALDLAKERNLLVSTHLLESRAENFWLRFAKGKFKDYLKNFTSNPVPFYSVDSFLKLFKDIRTLFTHCVYLKEWENLDTNLHSITHCAFSNRLLSGKSLDLKKALKSGLNIHLGTDGLSSNISLSMLDEMRANLLIHKDFNLLELAKKLILMATLYPAKVLNLNLGEIKIGKSADFSLFEVKECENLQLPLQFILNAKFVEKLFIKGKECKF